uniref:chorismate mutase n=1 Tax=Meloidogyne floridensis TaxID=298350 RepID=A0A915P3F2_9BILA
MSFNWLYCNLFIVILLFNIVKSDTDTNPDIDRFVEIADDRLTLSDYVALYKIVNNKSITDPKREEKLLNDMRSKGKNLSLAEDYVTLIFQDQINASKYFQNYLVNLWNQSGIPPIKVRDLNTDLRPAIDQINTEMLQLLVKIQKLPSKDCLKKVDKSVNNFIMRVNQIDEQNDALKMAVKGKDLCPACKHN